MQKKDWKSYLSVGMNDSGFTLLETMVAISLMSLAILLLSTFTEQSSRIQKDIKSDRQIEWHLFLNQLEYDLRDSKLISISSERFVVERPNKEDEIEKISYERYYKLLRRKVGNEGHQPVLTRLREIHMKSKEGQLWIAATFQDGESYTASLLLPLKEEEQFSDGK